VYICNEEITRRTAFQCRNLISGVNENFTVFRRAVYISAHVFMKGNFAGS